MTRIVLLSSPAKRCLIWLLTGLVAAVTIPDRVALAAKGDCGQPVSDGAGPRASDALAVLKSAVGLHTSCNAKPCICDCNGDGKTTAVDALCFLRCAVKNCVPMPGVECHCPDKIPCTSIEITTRAGSHIDQGWTGIAHDSPLVEGAKLELRVVRRCNTDQSICDTDAQCDGGNCRPTCDCLMAGDNLCEIAGPTHQTKCVTTLVNCATNDDCAPGVQCAHIFGPPLPLSSGGAPVCRVSFFDGPISGTADLGTGDVLLTTVLRSRAYPGFALDQPCPRCGRPDEDPRIGDEFTCEGGPRHGAACTVEGMTENFGGTSSACPPNLSSEIAGNGQALRFLELATGATSRTAQLPCNNLAVHANPLKPASNPRCTDNPDGPVCTSNADCLRCTEDATVECTANGDCTGLGTCAEAPDQPITCGFWCHCGFCNNNPSLPCFENADCPDGQQCAVGTGSSTSLSAPQARPNDCEKDSFVCGLSTDEKCENTTVGSCSLQPYRSCVNDTACISSGAGTCMVEARPCFESRITRSGASSPRGSYCEFEGESCTTNADCSERGDSCVPDSLQPHLVALSCMPAHSTTAVNNVVGITGPTALRLDAFIKICRCGDGVIGCSEECDDGNIVGGDGCDASCRAK